MAINLVVSIAPVFFIAYLVQLFASWRWALFAGIAYAVMPLTVASTWFFMLDQPLTLICLASAICWQMYSQSPRYVFVLIYGALAAAAILVKGNGWLLGLFPLFHILIGRHWNLLRMLPTYVGSTLAIVVVLPWYWITTKISAEGFNFSVGGKYALQALTFNFRTLTDNLGFLGISVALLGIFLPFTLARQDCIERRLAVTSISLILATFALQSLVPVAFAHRYMAPALPFAVILAVIGIVLLTRMHWIKHQRIRRYALGIVAAIILFFPGSAFFLRESSQRNVRMADAAEILLSSSRPYIVVIDGSVGAEGAFVAEVLVRTHDRRMFVVRGSKLLSYSDFMGRDYRLIVKNSDEVMTVFANLGADAVVVERHDGEQYYPHNELLLEYLNSDASLCRKLESFKHLNREGVTHVFVAAEAVTPNIDAVRRVNFPSRKPSF